MAWLIACEESQTVCKAFRNNGIEAFSCDIIPTRGNPDWHIEDDAIKVAYERKWDGMIAFPPCTYLSNAGIGYFNEQRYGEKAIQRKIFRLEAYNFFMKLYNADIDKICIENPVGYLNSHFRKPDQVIHPYFFGEPWLKKTCLWLKNLPKLKSTNIIEPTGKWVKSGNKITHARFHDVLEGGKDNQKHRSKTFDGIAEAMAEQWGLL